MTPSAVALARRLHAHLTTIALLAACPLDEDSPPSQGDSGSQDGSDGGGSSSAADSSGGDPTTGGSDSGLDACPQPTEGPTMHPGENVESAEIWSAAGSPHLLPYDFTIHAPVLIEACARVQIGGGVTITVGEGGSLVTDGLADLPVVVERLDAEPWATIRLLGGEAQLFHTVLDGGGAVGNGAPDLTGALLVRAPSGTTVPTEVLRAHALEIRGSEAAGLRLDGLGAITQDSADIVITGGAAHPISASATLVGSIPAGTYVGNADDRIVLTTVNTETIFVDATIFDRGVPYLIGQPGQTGELRVQGNAAGLAVLTIEPGVELQFQPGGVFTVEHAGGDVPATGALVAVGSADAPIVLTSAAQQPAAGDWLGLYFGGVLSDVDLVDHVRVEFAGGASSSGSNSCMYSGEPINNAAIRMFGLAPGAFVTNTEIVASAGHGIDRGWRDDTVFDMLDSNSFEVAGCSQTWPRRSDGTCPDAVPCP